MSARCTRWTSALASLGLVLWLQQFDIALTGRPGRYMQTIPLRAQAGPIAPVTEPAPVRQELKFNKKSAYSRNAQH